MASFWTGFPESIRVLLDKCLFNVHPAYAEPLAKASVLPCCCGAFAETGLKTLWFGVSLHKILGGIKFLGKKFQLLEKIR